MSAPHPPLTRSPFPYEGKALTRRKVSKSSNIGRGTSHIRRAKRSREGVLPFTSAGGAKPIAGRGGLEGFAPPHRFKARTAASDGHTASTRAARQRRAQVCGEIILKGAEQ